MFEGFVNPALVFGALLAAVPLIIHLLNRQRYRPMRWGAMRFVMVAYKKTRRRTKLENLLLLLLRMGAVALLALALARPFVGKQNALANLTERRRDLALVIDGSASTGYRDNVSTVFEVVVERARTLLTALDSARGDRVRLILAGSAPRLLSWRSPEEALDVLNTLREPFDEPLDLAASLSDVIGYVEDETAGASELEVRLLTDLQRGNFVPRGEAAESGRARLFEALDRLQKLGLRVHVEDLGDRAPTPANLAVTAIEVPDSLLATDVPIDVGVSISNFGATLESGVRLALEVDGERRPSKALEISARGETREVFPVVFRQSGDHTLVARLEADRLPVDDARAAVVQVPPPLSVLLVDGEPDVRIDADEVGYLAAILAPIDDSELPGASAAPFETRVIEASALRDPAFDFGAYDVIWLANVEGLSEATIQRLEKRVAAGAGLVISLGPSVAADLYNQRLWRADGSGLLPAELLRRVAVSSRRENYYRVSEFDPAHPAFAFFTDERWKPLLTEVPIYEFYAVRPLEDAHVDARLDDDAQSPLLVERRFDRGMVALWTTTIDKAWTRLPESPRTLVPLAHELLRHVGRPRRASRNVGVQSELSLEVPFFPREASLVLPDGARRPLAGEPEPSGPGQWRLPVIADTERVGLYRVEFEGEASLPFAVQLDPAESDLERIGEVELATLHPALQLANPSEDARGDQDERSNARGELWRWIAAAALAFLVLESLWAAWIGRRRSA